MVNYIDHGEDLNKGLILEENKGLVLNKSESLVFKDTVFSTKEEIFKELFTDKNNIYNRIGKILLELPDKIKVDDTTYQKRFYSIITEVLENILKHSSVIDNNAHKASFTLTKNNGVYTIEVINYCKGTNFEKLRNMCYFLNGLTKDEIKDLYKKTAKEAEISDEGGAGLGMMVIAKAIKAMDFNTPIFQIDQGGINGNVESKLYINFPVFLDKNIEDSIEKTK